MNKSDRRLKTIESQQFKKIQNFQSHLNEYNKSINQKSKKHSLKQSLLKENKDHLIKDFIPQQKFTHQMLSSSYKNNPKKDKPKFINFTDKFQQKQLRHKNLQNSFKANKSIIFSENKLANDLSSHTKLSNPGTDKKVSSQNIKQKELLSKKNSITGGSTKKKHSKSVYNYTELDDYKDVKKLYTKQSVPSHDRTYHNRSSFTQQPHQISTSSVTKRLTKSKSLINKILNNSDIKKKTKNFKVLADCLRTYIKEQLQENKKVQSIQIIKIIEAFNKTQISKVSKPLQKLIYQMIHLIHQTVNEEQKRSVQEQKKISSQFQNLLTQQKRRDSFIKQYLDQDIQSKIHVSYQTPQKLNPSRRIANSSQIKRRLNDLNISHGQQIQHPTDISKTKKLSSQQYDTFNYDAITEQNYHSSLSQDVLQMQKGLKQLQYEQKQLKKIIHEVSNKKQKQAKQKQQLESRKIQINKLKSILQKQNQILQKINNMEGQNSEMSQSSDQSSLKYYPTFSK